jgi:hypothetical protein
MFKERERTGKRFWLMDYGWTQMNGSSFVIDSNDLEMVLEGKPGRWGGQKRREEEKGNINSFDTHL